MTIIHIIQAVDAYANLYMRSYSHSVNYNAFIYGISGWQLHVLLLILWHSFTQYCVFYTAAASAAAVCCVIALYKNLACVCIKVLALSLAAMKC